MATVGDVIGWCVENLDHEILPPESAESVGVFVEFVIVHSPSLEVQGNDTQFLLGQVVEKIGRVAPWSEQLAVILERHWVRITDKESRGVGTVPE